jgi:hypothetical protein
MKEPVLEGPFDVELSPEDEARADALIDEAERDIEASQTRVTLRWDRGALDIIRRASQAYGLPYQTYLKHAALRQAIADLNSYQKATKRSA